MNRIAELRKAKNMSQSELGKTMNVSQNTISNWENGFREPSNDDLLALADFFDVSVDYLLGRSNEKSPGEEPELDINTLEYALYGEAKELDADEKRQLLDLARLLRKKRKEQEGK